MLRVVCLLVAIALVGPPAVAAADEELTAWRELQFIRDALPRPVAVGLSSLMYELDPDEALEDDFQADAAAARRWLEENQAVIDRMVELSRAPRLDWMEALPADGTPPSEFYESGGVAGDVLKATRILSADAAVALVEGDPEKALREVLAGFRLALLADERPFQLATLMRFAAETRMLDVVRLGWVLQAWDAKQLERLAEALPAAPKPAVLRRAFEGEREDRLSILESLRRKGEAVDRSGEPIEAEDLEPGILLAMAVIEDPGDAGARRRLQAFEESRAGSGPGWPDPWKWIAGGGLSTLRSGAFLERELAAARAARAALAAHRFRLETGRFPQTPEEVHAADDGPGGPLRFTVRGDRLIVYAGGPDGDDDGGVDPASWDAGNLFRVAVGDEEEWQIDGDMVFFGDGKSLDPPRMPDFGDGGYGEFDSTSVR